MKKNVTVENTSIGWVVLHNNVQVGEPHNCEQSAQLHAHHYRHAPPLIKTLKLKNEDGLLHGCPFWGTYVAISKTDHGNWKLYVEVDGHARGNELFKTRREALSAVCKIGREKVMTHNILNPDFGEFEISRSEKGGCTDPGTETYHCM